MTGTKNLKLFVLLLALFACGKEEQQPAEQRTEFSSVAEEEAVKEDFELKPVDFSSLTGWKKTSIKKIIFLISKKPCSYFEHRT